MNDERTEKLDRREPGGTRSVILALVLLAVFAWLTICIVRNLWLIVITLVQP